MVLNGRTRRAQLALCSYVGAVVVAGFSLALWGAAVEPWDVGPDPALFIVLLALLVGGESRPVAWLLRSGANHITPTWAFIAALVFLTGGYVAAPLVLGASVVGDVVARYRPSRVIFNGAMLALSVGAGVGVLDAFGQRAVLSAGGEIGPIWGLAALLSLAAMFLANSLLLAGAIALHEGLRFSRVLRRDAFTNFSTDGLLLSLGPMLVVLGMTSMLLILPLMLTWYLVFRSGRVAALRHHEATHDPLTGLGNRRLFFDRLQAAVAARGTRSTGVLGVMIIDLDDFKQVNDTLGHDVGDAVLMELAGRLRERAGDAALVARLGGDEFAVLCERFSDADTLTDLARDLHEATAEPMVSNGFPLTVTASVGLSLAAHGAAPPSASKLMRRADVAMYSAKASGYGVMAFGTDINDDSAPGRLALVSQLGQAIKAGELHVHYQPISDVTSRTTDRVEALVRWAHPVLGDLSPTDFIPLAEQTDLIGPLTEVVLAQALADCAQWERDGHRVGVAINLSARVVHDLTFPATFAAAVAAVGVDPHLITLEITENSVLREPARAADVLQQLRDMGARVAMDDFGTGFSSLSSLRDLPLDELKIDRRFAGAVLNGAEDEVIVRTIVALASELGLATVAEGAETEAIASRLAALGCGVMQGFHLARPMSSDSLEVWLAGDLPAVRLG